MTTVLLIQRQNRIGPHANDLPAARERDRLAGAAGLITAARRGARGDPRTWRLARASLASQTLLFPQLAPIASSMRAIRAGDESRV